MTTMTPFERQRRDWCQAGHTVLANGHRGIDEGLRAWAKRAGRLVWIDRRSVWGNPEPLRDPDDDEEREACIHAYARSFATRDDLHARLDELAGKVLVCWCTPQACHGEVLLGWSSPQFTAEYRAACRALCAPDVRPPLARPQPGDRASTSLQLSLWEARA